MTEHILDFSETGAQLSVRYEQLVIRLTEGEEKSLPLDELAVLSISHPCVVCTQSVLAGVLKRGGVVVIGDEKHMPAGLLLPLEGHCTQTERVSRQAAAPEPLRKRLWQAVVRAKIRAQAELLESLGRPDPGLLALAQRVRSGDPDNIEGQAARRYWPLLFNNAEFRRNPELEGINGVLNYGYAVLRAMTARAVVAAGLHPSLGLHHHNRYDAFCLADDLMEPFRPTVDDAAVEIAAVWGMDAKIDKEVKRCLLGALLRETSFHGEQRSLFSILTRVASSLADVFLGKRKEIVLPKN
jgi:CRISPR-associated protein Cas1